ncbi:unnamed protein product [Sphacelaria rigidula]
MGVQKLLGGIVLIGVTAVFILPASLKLVVGPKMPPYLGALIGMALGIPVMIFVGLELWKNLQANRQARKERQHQEAIEQQTYGCIQPQVLNSFVVFPVRVNKRGCEASSWVEIGEQGVVANLCAAVKVTGAPDTEGPLRRLCEATFKQDLKIIVYCGGGTAGPTGLAVGVGREGFGPFLASAVAHSIHDAIRLGIRVS